MKVIVGSKNPIKKEAVRKAFSYYFQNDVEVISLETPSKVSHQLINEEVFKGAKNRALFAKKINYQKKLKAKYFVGIEGGIIKFYSGWLSGGVICIIDEKGKISFATSSFFPLPSKIIKKLLKGKELGEVIDELAYEKNTKQKYGAIGFFTKGVVNREKLYFQGVISALIPFINKKLFV